MGICGRSPETIEPSRHTSRGQRLSDECSPIESRRSARLARFKEENTLAANHVGTSRSTPAPWWCLNQPAFLALAGWVCPVEAEGRGGGSATLVPSDDGARVGEPERRTGSGGRLATAADAQQTREEPRAAHHQVCDPAAGGEGRRARPESGEVFVVG